MGRVTQRRKVHKLCPGRLSAALEFPVRHREDVLAVEEPLEIRLGNLSFSVTMRTPGDDFDLVAGFPRLRGRHLGRRAADLAQVLRRRGRKRVQTFNVVEAQLRPDVPAGHRAAHLHVQLVRDLRHGLH
jgi:FdhD protein